MEATVMSRCLATGFLTAALAASGTAFAISLPASLIPGSHYHGVTIDNHGEARTYDVYVGKTWSATGAKAPVVIERLLGQTQGFQAEVDAGGYLWVTPVAILPPPDDRFLFYVNEYPGTYEEMQGGGVTTLTKGDDWGYLGALIEELVAKANADTARVFMTGLSNGGLLTYNVGGHMAHRFAAIAPVAGAFVWNNMPTLPQDPPDADCPLSVIHFHGDADAAVAYGGVVGTNVTIWSAHQSSGYWVERDHCGATPTVDATSISGASIESWTGCSGGREVELVTQLGAGHVMPGYAVKQMFAFFADKTACSAAEVTRSDAGTANAPAKDGGAAAKDGGAAVGERAAPAMGTDGGATLDPSATDAVEDPGTGLEAGGCAFAPAGARLWAWALLGALFALAGLRRRSGFRTSLGFSVRIVRVPDVLPYPHVVIAAKRS
jgi:polyhydroxybutyrate depolymerase